MKKQNVHLRLCLLAIVLIFLWAACTSKSTPDLTQIPSMISSTEESPLSPATPAVPTITLPTGMISSEIPLEAGIELFKLSSDEFAQGDPIPARFTCDGEDISPPLQWGDPPRGTKSFALIFDDPDAQMGTWVHWMLYNIPANVRALPEAIPPEETLPDGSRHGENSWGRLDYGGSCPPGGTHRYYFKLYALDVSLDLEPGADKESLLQAMEDHILAQIELMGTYTR